MILLEDVTKQAVAVIGGRFALRLIYEPYQTTKAMRRMHMEAKQYRRSSLRVCTMCV